MKFFARLSSLIFLIFFIAPPSFAQDVQTPDQTDILAKPYYDFQAQQAWEKQPKDFDFGAFRMRYARTDYYDPLGTAAKDRLVDLAYDIRTEKDADERKKFLEDYKTLIMNQLANIDVVSQAIVLAKDDKRFGDPNFFRWMRAGLLQSVLDSGDGVNLFRAYDVVTLGEDTALIGALHVKSIKIETRESGGDYYNLHTVTDADHTGPYTIFVDTTKPMTFLTAQKSRQGRHFFIPRQ